MTLLAFENVSKSYGATAALNNVSLEIPAGKIVGLLGPNGSGKTTLIKVVFPDPFGPRSPTIFPAGISRETLLRAAVAP